MKPRDLGILKVLRILLSFSSPNFLQNLSVQVHKSQRLAQIVIPLHFSILVG